MKNSLEINQDSIKAMWAGGRPMGIPFNNTDLEDARIKMLKGVEDITEFQRGFNKAVDMLGQEKFLQI